jgi:hypothetical protein
MPRWGPNRSANLALTEANEVKIRIKGLRVLKLRASLHKNMFLANFKFNSYAFLSFIFHTSIISLFPNFSYPQISYILVINQGRSQERRD